MGIVLERVAEFRNKAFMRYRGEAYSYAALADGIVAWLSKFPQMDIRPGDVVAVIGHISPAAVTLLLALLENRNIVVPLDDRSREDVTKRNRVARAAHVFTQRAEDDTFGSAKLAPGDSHPLLDGLRCSDQAGIILFTSGSTGESKAAVHAFERLFSRHASQTKRKPIAAMVFLKFDHIGGLNTTFAALMNGGCMIPADARTPEAVAALIEREKVELLPTTPSFLNMLIVSRVWEKHDLSSLTIITYGTEPMPESTLRTMHKLFPRVTLKQTYGLTELGILPTRSLANDTTFMAIREGDVQLKVERGLLHIKSPSAMLGYLNAPSPFDEDGWYNTGDRVVVQDGYTKILGRDSEIINVGGEKVFPSEVESVLLEMDNVLDVAVAGKASPITGQIVMAAFRLAGAEDLGRLRQRVWKHCQGRLESYKVPRHIVIADADLHSDRFKKNRRIAR